MFNSFVTPWTVARQVLFSMDSPGKNTGVVAISFSRGSPRPRDQTCVSCTGRWIVYHWTTREAQDLFGTLSQNYETSALDYGSEIFSKRTLWPISWNDCITNLVWQFFSGFEFFRVHGLIRESMYGRPSPLRHTVRGLTFLAPSSTSCLFPFPHHLLPNLGVA